MPKDSFKRFEMEQKGSKEHIGANFGHVSVARYVQHEGNVTTTVWY